MVECLLPKQKVAGSNPVSRSLLNNKMIEQGNKTSKLLYALGADKNCPRDDDNYIVNCGEYGSNGFTTYPSGLVCMGMVHGRNQSLLHYACRNCPIRNLVHTEIGRDEYYALTDIDMGYGTERLENDQDFCKKIDGLKIIYKLNQ